MLVLGGLAIWLVHDNWSQVGGWVVALATLAALVAVLVAIRRAWRQRPLVEIDMMSGGEFESYLHGLFKRLGYGVKHTGRSGDYGCDLVVTDSGGRVVVQAKRYARPLGLSPIQQAVAAQAMYGAYRSIVVTNRSFTDAARRLAKANGVELVDRAELARMAARAGRKDATHGGGD